MSKARRQFTLSKISGTGFYVQALDDESSQQIRHSAIVLRYLNNKYLAELQEDTVTLESGQEIFVYYESGGKFKRQPARIVLIKYSLSGNTFTFQFTGDTESGESRLDYRVSTAIAQVNATFGGEENCQVLNVSASGLALIAAAYYEMEDIVDVIILFEDESFRGPVQIQRVRELSEGRFRYGMSYVEDKATGESLRKGLQQISSTVQRQHLRRIAKAS